ncbi:MAG: hypothetical protein L0Y54_18565 [Sporichthyaceae bacterium]|nr:hypothetical protein [Sporichthyaceae bacterium]
MSAAERLAVRRRLRRAALMVYVWTGLASSAVGAFAVAVPIWVDHRAGIVLGRTETVWAAAAAGGFTFGMWLLLWWRTRSTNPDMVALLEWVERDDGAG